MADVGGLVRIDICMFDDDFAGGPRFGAIGSTAKQSVSVRRAVQPEVDVTAAGHFHLRNPFNRWKFRD